MEIAPQDVKAEVDGIRPEVDGIRRYVFDLNKRASEVQSLNRMQQMNIC